MAKESDAERKAREEAAKEAAKAAAAARTLEDVEATRRLVDEKLNPKKK